MPDSRHVTLVASTVTTVTLDRQYGTVEVVNVDGTDAVYFTVNGTVPAVASDGTIVLPAVIGGVDLAADSNSPTVVKLISEGTPQVAVRGW